MDFDRLYEKALKFLSFRPRSEKEIRDNLKKKKAPDSTVDLIIKKLRDQKFLNDKEFTKWWIEQRTIVKPTGVRIIRIELQRKGIDKEMMQEVLEDSSDIVHNELDMARNLVARKFKKYKGMERQEVYRKLGGFLSRRGFDYDTIKKAIDEILRKE
ncbi:MAG TPA: regulatory protein RecX [Patescibacteria group bacterium]|nr:regulatory protein RecX [Patescibacteria group bacterium]